MTILWVENHAQFTRFATRQFLTTHTITVVPSLAAARTALAGNAFAVLMVDYDLDDGKGDELVREVRQLPNGPWVVATSSHEEGNRLLIQAGAHAICSKMQFSHIAEVLAQLTGK